MAMPRVLCCFRLLINSEISLVCKQSSVPNRLFLNKCAVTHLNQYRTNHTISSVINNKNKISKIKDEDKNLGVSSSSSSSDSDSDEDEIAKHRSAYSKKASSDKNNDIEKKNEVTITYHSGLPRITVPLPSRKEKCCFTLRPISNTVGDFLEMLKKEDGGIDRVACMTPSCTRIASSNTIETLLEDNFKLVINDNTYNVCSPEHERLTADEVQKLNDIKTLVHQLYEALNIKDHQVQKTVEMSTDLETLKQELLPLEQQMAELDVVAEKKSNWLAWAGLGLMSVQFGILARLTWWEYSWDIMEPVTYFVTYGTAMACYGYYVLTKTEYMLNDVRDRQHLLQIHKKAKKEGFDLAKYNNLKFQISQIERKIKKVKDPLKLNLPPKIATTDIINNNVQNKLKKDKTIVDTTICKETTIDKKTTIDKETTIDKKTPIDKECTPEKSETTPKK